MENLDFAVLVDAENIKSSCYQSILSEISKEGRTSMRWVYADWTSIHMASWKTVLQETSSRPKQQFHHGKDAADHAMIMDAIEMRMLYPKINAICIISSDGGFYSLAQRLRENGFYVVVMGKKDTPSRLISASDKFICIDDLVEDKEKETYLDSLLINSFLTARQGIEDVDLGRLGSFIRLNDQDFSPKNYGYRGIRSIIKSKDYLFKFISDSVDSSYIELINKKTLTGNIRTWDKTKGFGVILSKNENFIFNANNLKINEEIVKPGMLVEFTTFQDIPDIGNEKTLPVLNIREVIR